MRYEDDYEGHFVLFHGALRVHAGSAGRRHAALDGPESFTDSSDEDRSLITVTVSSTVGFRHEHPAEAHRQAGLEAEESLGRFHQVLPTNQTSEFLRHAPAAAKVPARVAQYFGRSEGTFTEPRHVLYGQSGKPHTKCTIIFESFTNKFSF